MSIHTPCCALLALLLTACGGAASDATPSATATVQADSAATSSERPQGERVNCAVHYATARDAVLGTLRGTEYQSLIVPVTALSDRVLSPLPEGASLASMDCNYGQRQLFGKREPDATPARALAPACAALVERIDLNCLQPLAQRGVPLPSACQTVIVGIAASREELDSRLRNDGYCTSMASKL